MRNRLFQFAQRVDIDCGQRGALKVRRQQRLQAVQPAHFSHTRHFLFGAADVIQGVDHQTFGDGATALDQPAQLQVQARKHALQIDVDRHRVRIERFGEAAHDPPEAAC